MSKIEAIKAEYAPYHKMEAFERGFKYYMAGGMAGAHTPWDIEGVTLQAWDRGMEAAMRVERGK